MRGCFEKAAKLSLGAVCAAWLVGATPANAADRVENFKIDTAKDLVELCTARPSEELYLQSLQMCQGYAVGVAQYALLLFGQTGASPICVPDPAPSRNEAIADFVAWMKANPAYMEDEAPEALVRFLITKYPCAS